MNYGLYIAASGAAASMARLDVFSNNLSNAATVGFKPDFLAVRQREVVREEDNLPYMDSNELLERLGAGVQPTATKIMTAQGPIQTTGNDFDVAIDGEGFFTVRRGEGPDGIHLTRDGRFTLGSDGHLVTITEGARVLDERDQPIRLDPAAKVTVRDDGLVEQNGVGVARLGFASVPSPQTMIKAGANLLKPDDAALANRRPASGRVIQYAVEQSATDSISSLMGATGASRAASGGFQMIGMFNEVLDSAVNTLGRVS